MITQKEVNKIFFFSLAGSIIFLTGCAPKAYHKDESRTKPSVQAGYAEFEGKLSFLLPLRGEIVGFFGSKEDSVALKGILIESKTTDKVQAAQDGEVVLVDQNFKGYGKTIILEHPNGYSTVYAKNTKVLVMPGQKIRQGELIARSERKADGRSRLYFELRKNLKALDPLPYFKKF